MVKNIRMEKNYEHIRQLAIRDVKRRLTSVSIHIKDWSIVDRTHDEVKKEFIYTLRDIENISLKQYSKLEQIKYAVWRFDISKEEIREDY